VGGRDVVGGFLQQYDHHRDHGQQNQREVRQQTASELAHQEGAAHAQGQDCQEQHRLVGEDGKELPLPSQVGVGGADAESPQHQEYRPRAGHEEGDQQVSSGHEQGQGRGLEEQRGAGKGHL